ncbi:unnamed protein product, partial [marine sediment metagenome]
MRRKVYITLLFCCFTTLSNIAFCEEDYFKKGSLEYIAGNLEEAIIYIYKAYTKKPENMKIKRLLSEIYIEMAAQYIADGDYVEASKYLAEAKKLNLKQEKIKQLEKSIEKLEKPTDKPPEPKRVKPKVIPSASAQSAAKEPVKKPPQKRKPSSVKKAKIKMSSIKETVLVLKGKIA